MPLGVFSVISKQRWHRSIFIARPHALHATHHLVRDSVARRCRAEHPASHGGIRLKNDFAFDSGISRSAARA